MLFKWLYMFILTNNLIELSEYKLIAIFGYDSLYYK